MAEHHDVLDLQGLDAEFQRRRGAVIVAVRLIGRHQVGDVAHDEELTRPGIEDGFRRRPRIAATNHHHARLLAGLGELGVALPLIGQPAGGKRPVPFEQLWRKFFHMTVPLFSYRCSLPRGEGNTADRSRRR